MKKDKKALLEAELKRFNMLNEYSFYVPEGDDPEGDTEDLILGDDPMLKEEDPEEPDMAGLEDELDTANAEGGEEGGDVADPEMEGEPTEEPADAEPTIDEPAEEPMAEPAPIEDEVELDVTELVNSTDEAKAAAAEANQKIDQLMGMMSKLENQITDMNAIGSKIDNLESELEKRAPTPEEKIEMRSLDSYPYNLKLTDFWKTQDGKYNVLGSDELEGEPKEYTLTQDDVDADYSEAQVKRSLDDSNPYEEEDVY